MKTLGRYSGGPFFAALGVSVRAAATQFNGLELWCRGDLACPHDPPQLCENDPEQCDQTGLSNKA